MGVSKKYFRIEGNTVHLVTEKIERTVALPDLLAEQAKEMGQTTPILPKGCRHFSQKGSKTIFVIEEDPKVRSIDWTGMGENPNGGRWKLAFPYIVWVVVLSNGAVDTDKTRMFYKTSPVGSVDDLVCRPNLTNVYENCHICTGDIRVSGATLAQKAEDFIAKFWSSRFNSDLRDNNFNPAANRIPEVKNLEQWQSSSQKNQFFPLTAKWLEAGKLSNYLKL